MFLGADVSAEVALHLETGLRHDGSLPGLVCEAGDVPVGGPGGGAACKPRVWSAGPPRTLRHGRDGAGLAGGPGAP